MSGQVLTTFLLFSACVHYAASNLHYVQTSTNPMGTCIVWDCRILEDKVCKLCDRISTKENGQPGKEIYRLKKGPEENIFEIYTQDSDNSEWKKFGTYQEENDQDVFKVIIKDADGNIFKAGCLTENAKPTDEQEAIIKKLCNEENMQKLDNDKCKFP